MVGSNENCRPAGSETTVGLTVLFYDMDMSISNVTIPALWRGLRGPQSHYASSIPRRDATLVIVEMFMHCRDLAADERQGKNNKEVEMVEPEGNGTSNGEQRRP